MRKKGGVYSREAFSRGRAFIRSNTVLELQPTTTINTRHCWIFELSEYRFLIQCSSISVFVPALLHVDFCFYVEMEEITVLKVRIFKHNFIFMKLWSYFMLFTLLILFCMLLNYCRNLSSHLESVIEIFTLEEKNKFSLLYK